MAKKTHKPTVKRIRLSKEIEVSPNLELLRKLDEMRAKETAVGVSRASMLKIALIEAYDRRFQNKSK